MPVVAASKLAGLAATLAFVACTVKIASFEQRTLVRT